ncbi:MAG: matrixin family metalloprotease [Candidatus Bathyarchaeia archaeon]
MRKETIAGTVIFLLLLSASAAPLVIASPGTVELMGLEWNHDPLKVYIKAPPELIPHIITALNNWSDALKTASKNQSAFNFTIVTSSKGADIIINVQKGAAAGVLGMTILQDKNKDGYFDQVKITVKAGLGFDPADFRNVVRHEIGHALGLGHETTGETDLMDPTYDVSGIGYDIYPSTLDIEALLSIYGDDGFGGENLPPE